MTRQEKGKEKEIMKRWLSILLVLAMAISLCAFSGMAQAADTDKSYVKIERELLVQKNEWGTSIPYNRIPCGRVFDAVTDYVYDEYGALVSETTSYIHPGKRKPYFGAVFTYNDDRQIVGEKRAQMSYGLTEIRSFEYDERGYCTHWSYEWDTIGSAEADFSYDEAGNLTFVSLRVNGGEEQTMTPVYENGVQVATRHVAPDGGEVEEFFRYDEQGRVSAIEYDAAEPHPTEYLFFVDYPHKEFRYNPYKAGSKHVEILFHYAEDDLITEAEWKVNGQTIDRTRYSYPASKHEEGAVAFSFDSNSRGPFLWGSTSAQDPWDRNYVITTALDNPSFVETSEMRIVGDMPQYVDSVIDYEYDTRNILFEAEFADGGRDVSLEDCYPDLRESYLGTPVPTPDGSKRLIRVEMENHPNIPAVAALAYAEDGSLVGIHTYFDVEGHSEKCRWQEGSEFDEQGRVTYVPPMYGGYHIRYSDDGQSYTMIYSSGYEREIRLEDQQVTDWIKRGPLDYYGNEEVNEDGLLTKRVMHSADGQDYVTEYSYHWESDVYNWKADTEDNTALVTDLGWEVMVFDRNGYLLQYTIPSSIEFNFIYESSE